MNINNFTEFYNLIKLCGLQSTSPFDNFVKTVDQYIALCSCADTSGKESKLKDSKSIYVSIINGSISSYINTIKSKKSVNTISFYNGGNRIRTY